MVVPFSTVNNIKCPVESYEAVNLGNLLVNNTGNGISSDLTSPCDSDGCRTVLTDSSILGIYIIRFKVIANGGNIRDSDDITISVICSKNIEIINPEPL